MNSCAAAIQAGATGVVLCEQFWLADESPFVNTIHSKAWSQLDGSEAVLFGPEDRLFRLFSRSGREKLKKLEQALINEEPWQDMLYRGLRELDDPLISMGARHCICRYACQTVWNCWPYIIGNASQRRFNLAACQDAKHFGS